MPVILNPGSDEMWKWLDPEKSEWSRDLQSILKPFDEPLEVYPVSKDVGKVGNNSPSFIVSRDSKDNKYNITNFFNSASGSQSKDASPRKEEGKRKRDATEDAPQQSSADTKRRNTTGATSPGKGISPVKNEVRHPKQSAEKAETKGSLKITNFFQR